MSLPIDMEKRKVIVKKRLLERDVITLHRGKREVIVKKKTFGARCHYYLTAEKMEVIVKKKTWSTILLHFSWEKISKVIVLKKAFGAQSHYSLTGKKGGS